MSNEVFAALADPMRRHLYMQLAQSGPLTATALASGLAISRQAVAKHLGILSDAGMASSARVGRETRYQAAVEPLGEVQQWLNAVEAQWSERLLALKTSLEAPG